ncbi:hypothetical protein F4776DRAFT_609680 [Hypoxylon sp. NC0597]|nr:hypothetical protein F4776DRAFT_609680 [Hypoxylon sp. NC0597]
MMNIPSFVHSSALSQICRLALSQNLSIRNELGQFGTALSNSLKASIHREYTCTAFRASRWIEKIDSGFRSVCISLVSLPVMMTAGVTSGDEVTDYSLSFFISRSPLPGLVTLLTAVPTPPLEK